MLKRGLFAPCRVCTPYITGWVCWVYSKHALNAQKDFSDCILIQMDYSPPMSHWLFSSLTMSNARHHQQQGSGSRESTHAFAFLHCPDECKHRTAAVWGMHFSVLPDEGYWKTDRQTGEQGGGQESTEDIKPLSARGAVENHQLAAQYTVGCSVNYWLFSKPLASL